MRLLPRKSEMRKRRTAALCIAMLLSCATTIIGLAGCRSDLGYTPITDVKVNLTPTDQLVIELPASQNLPSTYVKAVSIFKVKYPDVNVTLSKIGDADDIACTEYQTTVATEMMAGSGPDVVLTDWFPDLYKTMDSGAFLNLNSIIAGDKDFNMGDYNAAIIRAGFYKGGQYIFPLGYFIPMYLAEQTVLDKTGFDLSKVTDVTSFFEEINSNISKMQENPKYVRVFDRSFAVGDLLLASGIRLLNPETKKVLPDEDAFRAFCEAYQPFYADDSSYVMATPTDFNLDAYKEVYTSGALTFTSIGFCTTWAFGLFSFGELMNGEPAFTAIQSNAGGYVALARSGVAINANSKNQLNAWNFIKILMSEKIEYPGVINGDGTPGEYSSMNDIWYPTNEAALNDLIKEVQNGDTGMTMVDTAGQVMRPLAVPDDAKAAFKAIHDSITSCVLPCNVVYGGWGGGSENATGLFYHCMTPYFNGEKSLDDCIAYLKNYLTIYASE